MTEVKLDLDGLEALAKAATQGGWGVEDPMDHCLTVVANPQEPVYDWKWVATCDWPDEDDHAITSREVKANAAFIAAFNPATALALLALAREAEGQGWRDIESAPKDGTPVLLYSVPNEVPSLKPLICSGAWRASSGFWAPGFWALTHPVGPSFRPTHWRPLPTPPSRTQSGEDAA